MIWILAVTLIALTVVPYFARVRKAERRTLQAEEEAIKYGLKEPASLHPVVDPQRCIGLGTCVSVCPEHDVLGLRDGQAQVISPARCVGHGLCAESCGVNAIELVFGTEKRGVDLPRINGDFETNVPRLFVVGELGGMGLIRNAFEQGSQCISGIARGRRSTKGDILDVLIVGCGPAGLSAALTCVDQKLRFEVIEKDDIGGTVRHYPRKKLVMTSPVKIPGFGKLRVRQILKEDLVQIWYDVILKTGLQVRTGEGVTGVTRRPDGNFDVTTTAGTYHAANVVLAIGRRGVPRKLGVPGESLGKVLYSLREPEAYSGDRILIVGGGDSAVEAALALSEQPGNEVFLSYRGDRLSRLKPANLKRIESAASRGRITILWSTNVVEIRPDAVSIRFADEAVRALPNDYVFIFAGGELPTAFLRSCGIEIDTKHGEPLRQAV